MCGSGLVNTGDRLPSDDLSSEAWLLIVSSTRKNFSASMAVTSLANFPPSLVESSCWKFNHLRQAAAIKFARQSIAQRGSDIRLVYLVGAKAIRRKPVLHSARVTSSFWNREWAGKADLGTIKPNGALKNISNA
jgi:hypothetical protein